ncbi:PREDICTED: polygalacturonase-like [Nelumbo nucifera]|uniref:Polygalacturonase-like n=2 Tax=Nelumbo nucifera TaxID=4432 RepID=A0A1U7ZE61_NELNU|nr:PREDICTED: polygalacturonase-like [Nelumbo nucifera]DAD43358.1 TPA_asm: hypothetical protein HUJ06_001588 [Nelumbo nucifera]
MLKILAFLFSLLGVFFYPTSADTTYNVVDLGARPDGHTDSTHAFLSAWAKACGSDSPATIYVPPGSFLLGRAFFSGPCKSNKVTLQIDGSLVAPSDYRVLAGSPFWLFFDEVDGFTINGGTIDGQGSSLWKCKADGKKCPDGARSLTIKKSRNIVINRLLLTNGQLFHLVIDGCENVHLEGVNVKTPGDSPNTDGIHVQSSSDVTILGSNIQTGDDCISIGYGATSLWMENNSCGPGHGISIGSLGRVPNEPGVQNVTVTSSTFTGTENGLRIKTFATPHDGFVNEVHFEHATMNNVKNPIIIDQNYCDGGCHGGASGVKISNVTYKDIHGTSATQVAMSFHCSPKNPCKGIILEDIHLSCEGHAAESSCSNAEGIVYGSIEPESCLHA